VAAARGQLRLCYDGHHQSVGLQVPTPCTHGGAMNVTVLLPAVTEMPARS
jgi:two-component system, OmpR family, sensor kinase